MTHINSDGEFQSDKYPTCPAGKVPLSTKDETAQDLLWEYAQRRRKVDKEFAADLEKALVAKGYKPPAPFTNDGVRELARQWLAGECSLADLNHMCFMLVKGTETNKYGGDQSCPPCRTYRHGSCEGSGCQCQCIRAFDHRKRARTP
jgi:hypothetical protein